MTMPEVGPVTAVAFVATLDDAERFRGPHQVEAAWRLATHKKRPETLALREWAERIARRRGQRIAMVALARKLSGILYAIWRDGTTYEPAKVAGDKPGEAKQAA